MLERPYHHGNLRATLLAAAEQALREQGPDAISLRDLARQTGVSHTAPRRHFPDRTALLAALAATGFARLGKEVAAARERGGAAFEGQLRSVAQAFVRFARDDEALLDLMFTVGKSQHTEEMQAATALLYGTFADLVEGGQRDGRLRPGDSGRLRLLMLATFQGIAGLATSEALTEQQIDNLLDDAVSMFLA